MNEAENQSLNELTEKIRRWRESTHEPNPGLMKEILDALCSLLASVGIEEVTVEYDGSGDEGMVEEVLFQPDQVAIPIGLEEVIEDFVIGVLPYGYQDNEGSYGTVLIAPLHSPRVEVEHSIRFTDVVHNPYHID